MDHRKHHAEAEPAAGAGLAVHLDDTAHPVRELLAYRQPQADACLALAPLLGLLERGEDASLVLRRDPHAGVLDAHPQLDPAFAHRDGLHAQDDASGIGELDCVAQQVQQNLPDALVVRLHQSRKVERRVQNEDEPFLLRIHADHRRDFLQQRGQLNRGGIQIEMAGTDPGQIQQIVDDGQQMAAAARDRAQRILAGGLGQRALPYEIGVAENGVQRRAQLMAHAGQELILGSVCRLRLRARRNQRLALFVEHGNPQHRRQQNRREDGKRRPDGAIVDLALVADR